VDHQNRLAVVANVVVRDCDVRLTSGRSSLQHDKPFAHVRAADGIVNPVRVDQDVGEISTRYRAVGINAPTSIPTERPDLPGFIVILNQVVLNKGGVGVAVVGQVNAGDV